MKQVDHFQNENQLPVSDQRLNARIGDMQREIADLKAHLHALMVETADKLQNENADEALFRHFIGSNVIAVHRSDIFGNIYSVNDACVELLGYSREEILSGDFSWRAITPAEYHHTDDHAIAQIKEKGVAVPWEKEYFHKDGHRVQILIGVVAADRTGRDCIVMTLNLTNNKRIERELKASEERFRVLAEAMPHIVWIAEPGGRTTYANQTFYDYTGVRREDDDGWAWLSTIHPDDVQACLAMGARAEKNLDDFEMEMRYRRVDGVYRWHLVRALPLVDPETGVTIWFGTCTDIDDKKKAEQELRESEKRFRTLADAIPQIVWTANAKGEIQFFNHRWFEYTGLSLEQSLDHGWTLLIHPADRENYMQQWNTALRTGETCEVEFRLRRAAGLKLAKDDPYRWHLGRAVALKGRDGSTVKWFATWTEIEDQKRKMGR